MASSIHIDTSQSQSQSATPPNNNANLQLFTTNTTLTTTATTNQSTLNSTQLHSPSKYDEAERTRQRMELLRKHHNESATIYNKTQPIINEQIKEETLKYLKNGQINGTKPKNQKPRAPKRQRSAANTTNGINANNGPSSTLINNNTGTTSPHIPLTPGIATHGNSLLSSNNNNNPQVVQQNGLLLQQHIKTQPQPRINQHSNNNMTLTNRGQPTHQMSTMYQAQPQLPHNQPQQQNVHQMHHQPPTMPQQQPRYKYQNNGFGQPPQLNMQINSTDPNQYQPPHTIYRPQPPQQSPQMPPTSAPPTINHHQPVSGMQQGAQLVSQPHQIEHNHFMSHQVRQQHQTQQFNNAPPNNTGHQSLHHQNHSMQTHQIMQQPQYHSHQQIHNVYKGNSNLPYTSLPNDLDLNLQAGLECDVDSVIKHEMSVEGQLDFNQDLLLRLDNPYTSYH